MSSKRFTKHGNAREIAAEAAGLRELAGAARAGGAPVVRLLDAGTTSLETAQLDPAGPSASAAETFGRRLARTHAFSPDGTRVFGQVPRGLDSSTGTMGKARLPLVAAGSPPRAWGEFYAEDRLLPYLNSARDNGSISADGARAIERLCGRLKDGAFDAAQPELVKADAALLHGDLWAGNILWAMPESAASAAEGFEPSPALDNSHGSIAVLIDPACQGGHAESDLAQLTVFNAPFTDRIYAAYNEVSPLAEGWQDRIGLHTLHILIIHAALFGGGYGRETVEVAKRYG